MSRLASHIPFRLNIKIYVEHTNFNLPHVQYVGCHDIPKELFKEEVPW